MKGLGGRDELGDCDHTYTLPCVGQVAAGTPLCSVGSSARGL